MINTLWKIFWHNLYLNMLVEKYQQMKRSKLLVKELMILKKIAIPEEHEITVEDAIKKAMNEMIDDWVENYSM